MAGFEAPNDIIPARELDAEPSYRCIEQPACLVFGRGELKPDTCGPDCLLVPDFSFDFDDVAQKGVPLLK